MNGITDLFKPGSSELGLTEFLISVVFSLAVGFISMLIYRLYFLKSVERNESLAKSFVLIAPSISAIFWAIQYSLPLSLGLLGALSFVRFRAPIKKAEDIGFILLVIALSLLSSVFRFYAALMLLGVTSAMIFLKSSLVDQSLDFLRSGEPVTAFVTAGSRKVEETDAMIRAALVKRLSRLKDGAITLDDVVAREAGFSLRYSFYLRKGDTISSVVGALRELEHIERVEVYNGRVSP